MYRIVLILLVALYGCGFQEQDNNINFSFAVDVNQLEELASSSSGLSSSNSNLSSNTAASVTSNDELMFFGVVVRTVDGPVTDASGNPLGQIVPGASKFFNLWQNPQAFYDLMVTGKVNISTYVPAPSTLSVTFYGVLIGEPDNQYTHDGPGTFTTFYHVGGPYVVDGAGQTITVAPDMNILEDDHAPFAQWTGIFAKSDGTPLANTDISLEHCRIGFKFEQSMFDDSYEDQYAFHTDSQGMIDSYTMAGVDWRVFTGDGVTLRPCGAPLSGNNYNFESGTTNSIAFYAFVGNTMSQTPNDFLADLAAVGGNSADFFEDSDFTTVSPSPYPYFDHDGDLVPSNDEVDYLGTNPFMHDSFFESIFSSQIMSIENVVSSTFTDISMHYDTTVGSTGSCSSGWATVYKETSNGGATPFISGTPSDDSSGNCTFSFAPPSPPPSAHVKFVAKIFTGRSFDYDGDSVNEQLFIYRALDYCGSGCIQPTITNTAVAMRTYGNGPSDTAEPVSNLMALKAGGSCGSNDGFEYLFEITGTNLGPGGTISVHSSSSCNSLYSSAGSRLQASATNEMAISVNHYGNATSPTLYLCVTNAVDSTLNAISPAFKFNYDATSTCQSEVTSFMMDSQVGSIPTASVPHFDISFDNSTSAASLRLNFSGGKYMCVNTLSGFNGGCSTTFAAGSTMTHNFASDYGNYTLGSVDLYQSGSCAGTAQNVPVQSASSFTYNAPAPLNVTGISIDTDDGSGVSGGVIDNPSLNISTSFGVDINSVMYSFNSGSESFCLEGSGTIFATGATSYTASGPQNVTSQTSFGIGSYTLDQMIFYSGNSCDAGTEQGTTTTFPTGPHFFITAT